MTRCLYCLRQDVSFNSEEHPIPRGLGNEEIVLDKGVVCDHCNNGVLSELDSVLLDFDPIKFNRAFYGVKSRSGDAVTYKNVAFTMSQTSENHVHLDAKHAGKKTVVDTDDGFKLNMRGARKSTPKYLKSLSRALYKIGLGLIYLDLGSEIAYSQRFDEVRKIILGDLDFEGFLIITKKPKMEFIANVQHFDRIDVDGSPISLFRFYYYGIEIFYEMEKRKVVLPDNFPKDQINLLEF